VIRLLLGLLLSVSVALVAQPLRIEYFTVNDGLSTRDINDLHIGEDGFLWASTMDGLNRFDGQRFRVFGQGAATTGGLSRGAVASVRPDNEGKFIVKFRDFYGYFDRFDPVDFTVEQIRMVPSTGVIGYPRAITTDALGRTFVVTIGTEGTFIYEYTPKNDDRLFTPVFHAAEDQWPKLTPRIELTVLNNGELLLYDEENGFRLISTTGAIIERPFANDFRRRRFYAFAEGADGQVYFSFRSGPPLYRWFPEPGYPPVAVENLDYGLVYPRMFQDKQGQLLLVATEDILGAQLPEEYYLIDTMGQVSLFEEPLPVNRSVAAMTAIDFRETVYLGLREGLGVVERYVNPVASYLDAGEDNPLSRNNMRGICEDDDGRVYFMEEEGNIYFLDSDSDQLDTLLLRGADDGETLVTFRGGNDLLYDRSTHSLWGTGQPRGSGENAKGGILFRHDIGSGFTTIYRSKYALGALCFGDEGKLFVAASDPGEIGLLLWFDRSKERFYPALLDGAKDDKVAGFRINYLHNTGSRNLLLGTANRGLLGYNPRTGFLSDKYLTTGEGEQLEIGNPAIYVIYIVDDHWWLGTETGLYDYEVETGSVRHYGRQEGLSNSIVYGIVPVPGDPTTGSFRRYYREDGLSNDQFSPFSFHRGQSDGRYFFGGSNGLTVFRESDLSTAKAGADVMLTEIRVSGRETERTRCCFFCFTGGAAAE